MRVSSVSSPTNGNTLSNVKSDLKGSVFVTIWTGGCHLTHTNLSNQCLSVFNPSCYWSLFPLCMVTNLRMGSERSAVENGSCRGLTEFYCTEHSLLTKLYCPHTPSPDHQEFPILELAIMWTQLKNEVLGMIATRDYLHCHPRKRIFKLNFSLKNTSQDLQFLPTYWSV